VVVRSGNDRALGGTGATSRLRVGHSPKGERFEPVGAVSRGRDESRALRVGFLRSPFLRPIYRSRRGTAKGETVGDNSSIEWTDATWNPATGCTKVSPGCKHCYAERLALRLQAMGNRRYRDAFTVTLHEDVLSLPLRWARPRRIFVNSMSDLFHEDIPDWFIGRAFEIMQRAHWHNFQVLTKRAERLADLALRLPWPPNVWQGVSVESARYTRRVSLLQRVPAAVRFLSVEPLLGPIPRLPLDGIQWVIVGGESGPRHRAVDGAWVRAIRDQCSAAGVPFFFKQWGGRTPKAGGRSLDGRTWDEMPRDERRCLAG
jgi:protein gp37